MIQIPAFKAGHLYQVAARLRYRVRGGAISWSYELYRPEKVLEHAFDEALEVVTAGTLLPVIRGIPEPATAPASL